MDIDFKGRDKNITAEIITDSINPENQRLTSFVLNFPRCVLSEFNTHRMFSRNSASSRAIKFDTNIENIKNNPFIPIKWIRSHKGMQGYNYHEDDKMIEILDKKWLKALDDSIKNAKLIDKNDVTKQFTNRLLEPYSYHKVIMTTSSIDNFIKLRAEEGAEIHIQNVAYKILDVYNKSEPKKVDFGGFHIPFGDKFDTDRIIDLIDNNETISEKFKIFSTEQIIFEVKKMIATARCARVSYLNYEGTDDYEKDINLFMRLEKMGHWSPFEHVAKAVKLEDKLNKDTGNFRGWKQLRKNYLYENPKDPRIIVKKY